jgi:hypothetical protein
MRSNPHADAVRSYLEHLSRQSSFGEGPLWPEWVRRVLGATVAVGVSTSFAGCGGDIDGTDAEGAAGAGGISIYSRGGTVYGIPGGGTGATSLTGGRPVTPTGGARPTGGVPGVPAGGTRPIVGVGGTLYGAYGGTGAGGRPVVGGAPTGGIPTGGTRPIVGMGGTVYGIPGGGTGAVPAAGRGGAVGGAMAPVYGIPLYGGGGAGASGAAGVAGGGESGGVGGETGQAGDGGTSGSGAGGDPNGGLSPIAGFGVLYALPSG